VLRYRTSLGLAYSPENVGAALAALRSVYKVSVLSHQIFPSRRVVGGLVMLCCPLGFGAVNLLHLRSALPYRDVCRRTGANLRPEPSVAAQRNGRDKKQCDDCYPTHVRADAANELSYLGTRSTLANRMLRWIQVSSCFSSYCDRPASTREAELSGLYPRFREFFRLL
jgi:hypothetical protein